MQEEVGKGDPWISGLEFPPTMAQSHPCSHSGPTALGKHKENNLLQLRPQEMETVIRELQGEIS